MTTPPPSAPVPIAAQVAEVERELRERVQHRHPYQIKAGRLKPDTAAAHTRDLAAALATLRTIAAHADGLRALIAYLRVNRRGVTDPDEIAPSATELDCLLATPGVAAVLEAFPDAVLTAVRPIAYPPPPVDTGEAGVDATQHHT